MHKLVTAHVETTAKRLTVVVDSELMSALVHRQQQVERETRLRISLSQVAGSLMRKGLMPAPNTGEHIRT